MRKLFLITIAALFTMNVWGQWNTSGTNIYNSNTGNVGIGTTNPSQKLDVNGNIQAVQYIFSLTTNYDFTAAPRTQIGKMSIKLFDDYYTYRPGGTTPENNSYGTLLAIYGRSGHWESNIYFGANTKKMYFRTSTWSGGIAENGTAGGFHEWRTILDSKSDIVSTGLLKITGNGNHYISQGNVGIGTTNPTAKLHVIGKIRTTYIDIPEKVLKSDATNNVNAVIGWSESGILGIAGTLFIAPRTNLINAGIGFWTANQVNLNSEPINRMYIHANGNIGIGTATPDAHLDIANTNGDGYLFNTELGTDQTKLIFKESNTNIYSLFYDGSGSEPNNKLHIRDEKYGLNIMTFVQQSGNVGIGTTNPGSFKLAVEGKIGAREVVVTTDVWSDFVFEPEYKLMSLKDLETFIKANKHLPEIPTTAEVKENGIAVGEMNAKLLQKIEELTLYTIQQQELIEALKSEMETQNKRIEGLEKK